MSDAYPYLKALHVFSVVVWVGAQLALPMLLGAHRAAAPTGEPAATLLRIEGRLIGQLLNPAMFVAFTAGGLLLWRLYVGDGHLPGWLLAKLALVFALAGLHGELLRAQRHARKGRATWAAGRTGSIHALDLALLAGIVLLVLVRPA